MPAPALSSSPQNSQPAALPLPQPEPGSHHSVSPEQDEKIKDSAKQIQPIDYKKYIMESRKSAIQALRIHSEWPYAIWDSTSKPGYYHIKFQGLTGKGSGYLIRKEQIAQQIEMVLSEACTKSFPDHPLTQEEQKLAMDLVKSPPRFANWEKEKIAFYFGKYIDGPKGNRTSVSRLSSLELVGLISLEETGFGGYCLTFNRNAVWISENASISLLPSDVRQLTFILTARS